jgi:hypothetical protein
MQKWGCARIEGRNDQGEQNTVPGSSPEQIADSPQLPKPTPERAEGDTVDSSVGYRRGE